MASSSDRVPGFPRINKGWKPLLLAQFRPSVLPNRYIGKPYRSGWRVDTGLPHVGRQKPPASEMREPSKLMRQKPKKCIEL